MKYLVIILIIFFISNVLNANIYYVKVDGDDAKSGKSWDNAFATLYKAYDVAVPGDEVWVAAGIYKPSFDYYRGIGERGNHFRIKRGVSYFGGFPNSGNPGFEDRNWFDYQTILCGDLNDDDITNGDFFEWRNREDNCYSVIFHDPKVYASQSGSHNYLIVLDGFVVRNGNANSNQHGTRDGGGLYFADSRIIIRNCIFQYNSSLSRGGGIYISSGRPIIENSFILNNYSQTGGGIYFFPGTLAGNFSYGHAEVINTVVAGNRASYDGGGIITYNTSIELLNCTIADNSAKNYAGGLFIQSVLPFNMDAAFGNAYVRNTIIYGNNAGISTSSEIWAFYSSYSAINSGMPYLEYSLVGPGVEMANMTDIVVRNCLVGAVPKFLEKGFHYYRLREDSPCIDNGNDEFAETLEWDVRGFGFQRKLDKQGNPGRVDIGAYEYNYYKDNVSVKDTESLLISLYPNPTRDILHIRTDELISRVELSDVLGNVVIRDLTPTLSKGEGVSLNVEGLPAGMYFLKLYTMSGRVLVEKVIVGF